MYQMAKETFVPDVCIIKDVPVRLLCHNHYTDYNVKLFKTSFFLNYKKFVRLHKLRRAKTNMLTDILPDDILSIVYKFLPLPEEDLFNLFNITYIDDWFKEGFFGISFPVFQCNIGSYFTSKDWLDLRQHRYVRSKPIKKARSTVSVQIVPIWKAD